MKSFFKKLAFVMALAMVVSLAAPAAKTAVAAEEKEMKIAYQEGAAITEVNLAKLGATEDLRFVYAPANWKELGVTWNSTNPNVVTVDNNGVITAVAAGSAIVTVAVGTEVAYVTVNVAEDKADLPVYTATMGTKENREITEWTLENVGDTIDLAFFGILDYSVERYTCEWFSVNEDVATVDEKGLVTAVAPGKAKITLGVMNLITKQKHEVSSCIITVPEVEPEVTEVTMEVINEKSGLPVNTTQNKVVVKFSEPTEVKDLEVFYVFSGNDDLEGVGTLTPEELEKGYMDWYVKDNGVTANEDKTIWTIEVHKDFVDGGIFEISVNKEAKEEYEFTTRFTASVGAVATVIVKGNGKAALATEDLPLVPETLSVKLYDAKGVDVTTRVVNGLANNDDANINYELVESSDNYSLFYDELEFYADDAARVYAIYDNADVEVPVESTPITVRPGTRNAYDVAKIIDWTIVNLSDGNAKPDWSAPVHTVPAEETNYVIATLLQDTRGDYYCTLNRGCTFYNSNNKYNGEKIYWTEDTGEAFWLNGFYVEYKAMHMDKMLVETDGEIASYEEGQARFALYLYNQNYYGDDIFQRELYSQYVKVCHPKQLANFTVNMNTINLMKNTESDVCVNRWQDGGEYRIYDAYYTEFSQRYFEVVLKDIHGGDADWDDALTADFTIELTSEKNNGTLKYLVETVFLNRLGNVGVKRGFNIGANDFVGVTNKSQVKFRITDNTTKKSQNITINLIDLKLTNIRLQNAYYWDDTLNDYVYTDTVLEITSDVALVKEYWDTMKSYIYFEKFVIKTKKYTVDNRINDYDKADKPSLDGWEIKLYQQDKNGNDIGYDNNLYVANAPIVNDKIAVSDIHWYNAYDTRDEGWINGADHDEYDDFSIGDRVMVVTDNSGKVYPVLGFEYANPAYNAKEGEWAAPSTTSALGVFVKEAGTATSAQGVQTTATDDGLTVFTQYCIQFRTVDPDTEEIIYAKNGTYTATIRTIEDITDGIITFARETGLTEKVTFTVKNTNAQAYYAGRDFTTKDASITDYIYDADKTITREKGDDENVKELILQAFNFGIEGVGTWGEKWDDYGNSVEDLYKLDTTDILYYTFTVTPSNDQLVINDVVFKIPAERAGDNTFDGNSYGWYRSTVSVNKSITFED